MGIKLNSSGGGSVEIVPPVTGSTFTLTAPANNANLVCDVSPTISGPTFTGNVAVSGANSYISINGSNISQYSGMMKNRIINGDMRIDQRFAGAANNNIAGGQYVVDRWAGAGGIASKLRFQQNNTNGPGSSVTQNATGFPYYFGANTIAANAVISTDNWQLYQLIEGFNIADLGWGTANAQPVTLSFWTYSSIAGTHAGSIRNATPDRSYVFTFNVAAANTWQYQTITVPGDTTGTWYTNNNLGINLAFSYGVGSDKQTTAGSWTAGNYISTSSAIAPVASANGALYFTGVQLEKGRQATPFEFRHYGTELALCQRYFQTTYPIGTAVGATGTGGGTNWIATGSNRLAGASTLIVPMRTTPVVTIYDPAALNTTNVMRDQGNSPISISSPSFNGSTSSILTRVLTVSGSPFTTGQDVNFAWMASAELGSYQN